MNNPPGLVYAYLQENGWEMWLSLGRELWTRREFGSSNFTWFEAVAIQKVIDGVQQEKPE